VDAFGIAFLDGDDGRTDVDWHHLIRREVFVRLEVGGNDLLGGSPKDVGVRLGLFRPCGLGTGDDFHVDSGLLVEDIGDLPEGCVRSTGAVELDDPVLRVVLDRRIGDFVRGRRHRKCEVQERRENSRGQRFHEVDFRSAGDVLQATFSTFYTGFGICCVVRRS